MKYGIPSILRCILVSEVLKCRKKKKVLQRMNLWLGQGKGEEEELVREFGTNMYPLLYFKWMANRHLLCIGVCKLFLTREMSILLIIFLE